MKITLCSLLKTFSFIWGGFALGIYCSILIAQNKEDEIGKRAMEEERNTLSKPDHGFCYEREKIPCSKITTKDITNAQEISQGEHFKIFQWVSCEEILCKVITKEGEYCVENTLRQKIKEIE